MEKIKKKTIILLNGPSGSGKFKIASILQSFYQFEHHTMWGDFRNRVHNLYGLNNIPDNYFHDKFHVKTPMFRGQTPAETYKKVLREFVIPNHGHSFILDPIIDKIDKSEKDKIVISDIGNNLEADYFFNYYGSQTMILKITKHGKEFQSPSNRYVDDRYTFVTLKGGTRRPNRAIINNDGNYVDVMKMVGYYYQGFFEKGLNYVAK